MPGDTIWTTRVDPTLLAQADAVLNGLGMTMSDAFTMLLRQIVREQALPLSLSLDAGHVLCVDLLKAQTARINGYEGRKARDVLKDMRTAIKEVEAGK